MFWWLEQRKRLNQVQRHKVDHPTAEQVVMRLKMNIFLTHLIYSFVSNENDFSSREI